MDRVLICKGLSDLDMGILRAVDRHPHKPDDPDGVIGDVDQYMPLIDTSELRAAVGAEYPGYIEEWLRADIHCLVTKRLIRVLSGQDFTGRYWLTSTGMELLKEVDADAGDWGFTPAGPG